MKGAWRQTLALLTATILGVIAGAAGEHARLSRPATNPMDATALLSQMDRRLGLSPSQHEAIARILARHQAALDSAWQATRPGVDSAHMEIVSVLSADQRARYLSWMRVAHGTTGAARSMARPRSRGAREGDTLGAP
ncbi:MAG TPA: hypothetical protein VFA43_14440 [Gemmatimonadaceae bacterium]|nr:hypothetical protein [Gemmatimonadaceae bacterium]